MQSENNPVQKFEIQYKLDNVKELLESIPPSSYNVLRTVQSRLDSIQTCTQNIFTISQNTTFSGLAERNRNEHLGVVLIATRMEGLDRIARETMVTIEYLDAVLNSLSRRSGIIIFMEKRLDIVSYQFQLLTIQNEVNSGDVMDLYHIAMYLRTEQLGRLTLMSRADYDLCKAEQIFRGDLFNIISKAKSKPPLSLSEKLREIRWVMQNAVRELICGLASC